jgi:4-amino-4-deoxy-L-arabinose transferase-like glycosyltransferase
LRSGEHVRRGDAHLGGAHPGLFDYVAHLPGSALYSVADFPLDFMPWTFIFLPAVISLWREKNNARCGTPLFLLLWFAGVFLFPHLSVVEHSHYLYSCWFPPLSWSAFTWTKCLPGR